MPSIIRVAFESPSPEDEVRGSYDLGRELHRLADLLQAGTEMGAVVDGGELLMDNEPVGAWSVEEYLTSSRIGGDRCELVAAETSINGFTLAEDAILHSHCNTYNDGTMTSAHNGTVLYAPQHPTMRGRIRV